MTSEDEAQGDLHAPEYLAYRMLKSLHELDDSPISRSKFWKLCCLADRHIQEEYDCDIGFPRHWYKYGELGEAHSVNRSILNAPSARFWQGQELYPDREIPDSDFDIFSDEQAYIVRAVERIVSEFGKKSVDEIKEYQYNNYPPNEFIEAYSQLREQFEVADLDRQALLPDFDRGGREQYIEDMLDEMMISFPESEYGEVHDLYLRWDDTMRMMLNDDADAVELKQFLDVFIERLSEITIRFKHSQHIPKKRLERWEEEKPIKKEKLETEVQQKREQYLNRREPSGVLNSVSGAFDETVIEDM